MKKYCWHPAQYIEECGDTEEVDLDILRKLIK